MSETRSDPSTAAMIASATSLPLKPAPITPSWVRGGAPEARNAILSRSADGMATTIVWDCTAGEFEWTYAIDETIYFLEGSAVISDSHAQPRRFGPGDVLFLPRGTVAHWHIENYVRKLAFCRRTQPALVTLIMRAAGRITRLRRRMSASAPKERDTLTAAFTA